MRVIGKTLLWGLIALTLVAVGLPGVIGFYMAREFDYAVANLTLPGTLEVADSHFDRGWFSSHAVISLRPVGVLCHLSPCPVITLDSTIHHGPLAFGAEGQERLRPVLAVADTRADPTTLWPRYVFSPMLGPIILHTRVGLDTRGHVTLHLDGMSFDVARQKPVAHIDSAALDGELNTAVAGRAIASGTLDWPSFDLSPQGGGRLAWRGLSFSAGRGAKTGAPARGHLHLESLTLDNGRGRATRLSGLDLHMNRLGSNAGKLSLVAKRVVMPDNTQGELHLNLVAQGVDAAAWAGLASQWRALGGLVGGAADDPRFYHDVLPGVLTPGFRFVIDQAALYTEHGPLRLSGHVAVPGKLMPANTAAATLRQLDIDLQIQVPAELARRLTRRQLAAERGNGLSVADAAVAGHLSALAQRGLIEATADGSAYRMRLRIANGRLLFNGHPRPGWQGLVAQIQATLQGL